MNNILNVAQKISNTTWEIPTNYKQGMNVPVRIYASERLLKLMDIHVILPV